MLKKILIALLATTGVAMGQQTPEDRFAKMTPEQVRAYEIEVMRSIADLALIPPKMNTNPLPEFDYDKLDYGMTIGIERTPKGRLWACWVAGGDNPDAYMVLATSDDNGETWSKPRLVVNSHSPTLPMQRSVLVGTLWTDPRGRLWFFFDQAMGMVDGRAGLWASVCDNPDAENPVWSEPTRIWHGSTLNKPTVLRNGDWMLPVQLIDHWRGRGPFKDVFTDLDPLRGAHVFVSKNEGRTWERRGKVNFPRPDWTEHMIVEKKDGTLWMMGRMRDGIMESFSKDGGHTWTEPRKPDGIASTNARFHLRRLASGRILLIKYGDKIDSHNGRRELTAWLSEDEGKTWKGGLMIDRRHLVTYPDATQAPDGTLYISYDYDRDRYGEILMARVTEEDILAGKLVNPDSKLLMLISRPTKDLYEKDLIFSDNSDGQPLLAGPRPQIEVKEGEVRDLSLNQYVFQDRGYTFFDLPEALKGKQYVYSSINGTEIVCRKAGVVYVVTPAAQRNRNDSVERQLLNQGFRKTNVPEFVGFLFNRKARALETCSVYQKELKEGETVRFSKFGIVVF